MAGTTRRGTQPHRAPPLQTSDSSDDESNTPTPEQNNPSATTNNSITENNKLSETDAHNHKGHGHSPDFSKNEPSSSPRKSPKKRTKGIKTYEAGSDTGKRVLVTSKKDRNGGRIHESNSKLGGVGNSNLQPVSPIHKSWRVNKSMNSNLQKSF